MNKQLKLLLLGCGDIATRLAAHLSVEHYDITGARRTPLAGTTFPVLAADATSMSDMCDLMTLGFDAVVVTMTPSQRSEAGYRNSYLKSMEVLLQSVNASGSSPLVLFVSSTSVYGQDDGQWVDEHSTTEPGGYSGQVILESERLLQNSDLASCIVRFSGIYGPGRQAQLRAVHSGKPLTRPNGWTNRIHSEDCAGVLAHLLEKYCSGDTLEPVYLASDHQPISQWQLRSFLCGLLGREAPPPSAEQPASGKRCRNQQLVASGYRFRYVDYRAGYSELIQQSEEN
ncbi:NAD(P)H-binding protein [Porticoccus sp. W117]|uniref:NAD-dependent epimerase/dehydratase family protein n=1 Tax=Porticoccus sp. W117 TaxID=3054777 RepID=UPI002595E546|nr:NAD-dependent epimerase/dehydratase family protein [Porticoccus sp. W117]MDM3870525.1 NAD(P)H-binding protein [Porticoccus sp. W117]